MDLKFLVWPGLIFNLFYQCYQAYFLKERLKPVRSFAVTPPVHSNNFKIQLAASALYNVGITPSPRQSPKEKN